MSADLALRALARLLPPRARARYSEEWRTDASRARELGLRSAGVVMGAALLVVALDRDSPAHTGEPRGALARRLARRGSMLVAACAVVLIGTFFTAGIAPEPGAAPAAVHSALDVAGWIVPRLALALGALGLLLLVAGSSKALTGLGRAALAVAAVGPALIAVAVVAWPAGPDPEAVPGAAASGAYPAFVAVVLGVGVAASVLGAFGVLAVAAGSGPLGLQPRRSAWRRRASVALVGAVVVLAVVVLGAVDTLVWNPLAKVPGLPLPGIYERMVSVDGFPLGYNVAVVLVWAVFWAGLALGVLALALSRRASWFTVRRIAIVMLVLAGGAIFFRFFAGFGFGMSIADTFGTSGGDGSAVSAVLTLLGQLSLAAALVAFGWAPRVRARPVELASA